MVISLLWALVFWVIAVFCGYLLLLPQIPEERHPVLFAAASGLIAGGAAAFPGSLFISSYAVGLSIGAGIGAAGLSLLLWRVVETILTPDDAPPPPPAPVVIKVQTAYVLDASVLSSGDIVKFINAMFTEGQILLPSFVVQQVQASLTSDSEFVRSQGQLALSTMDRLHKESLVPITYEDQEYRDIPVYADQMAQYLKDKEAILLCYDQIMAQALRRLSFKVVFLYEIEDALQHVHLVGQQFKIRIVEFNAELGQGIGYLPDGTKVVVEGTAALLQQEVAVIVQRVYQTVAGKMLFAAIES